MIRYNEKENTMLSTQTGEISETFVRFDRELYGMLYRPTAETQGKHIGILVMHSAQDYTDMNLCPEMAKRGFTVFGSRVDNPGAPLDRKLLDVKKAVNFLKQVPGVDKIVLMGHSGGATLMSAYQRAAENGISAIQGENLIYSATITEALIPADGCMFIDSNYGNGAMTLISIDPGIQEEGCGTKVDPKYDSFNPAVGFSPKGAAYTPEFLAEFFAAQGERNNRLIQTALDRLTLIQQGKGYYRDDEPFSVAGAAQIKPFNKLINQDLRLLSHTRGAYPLIHADGSVTTGQIPCLRGAFPMKADSAGMFATYTGTVRGWLSEQSVWAKPDYAFLEDGVRGIDWDNAFSCTPGNVKYIHCPVLAMGMSGSYEYAAAEYIMENCPSTDKSAAFVEGADHMISANHRAEQFPGQFGDTEKLTYDHMAAWLSEGRFA